MRTNTGAGAAVSSGASYQARVAAYLLAASICKIDTQLVPANALDTLGFETMESIDDLNIGFVGGTTIYVQAKAKIEYSLSPLGELRSVFKQFEEQNKISDLNDKFVLATSGRASKKITHSLRAALEAFRMSPERAFFRDQPKEITDIISDLRNTITELQRAADRDEDIVAADTIIRKSVVWCLDIEPGDALEQAIILNLQAQQFVAAPAVWGKIIADCVGYAKSRRTVDVARANIEYGRFRIDDAKASPDASEELLKIEFGNMNFPVGREVVLCRLEKSDSDLSVELAIMEFYRFDDECVERIDFSKEDVKLKNGLHFTVLRRASSYSGLMRMIDTHPELAFDKEIVIMPINSDNDFESGLCADTHRARLKKAALENDRPTYCIHCGEAVSTNDSSLVEAGSKEELVVGLSHDECVRPIDRILGTAKCEFFETYPELINFDVNSWFRAAHGGQMAFANAGALRRDQKVIGWGGRQPRGPIGRYVVEMMLAGGGSEIVTQRNGVHRFSRLEADEFVVRLNRQFEEAQTNADPFCYSDQSKVFGRRSTLLEQLGASERIVPIERAQVRPYEERFAARFGRPGQWYAPLMYLRRQASGEPFALHDAVVLLTDPLKLKIFLENWRQANIEVPGYDIVNILSDNEFDEFMRWVTNADLVAVVDPLLNPADQVPISGLPIISIEEIVSEHQSS